MSTPLSVFGKFVYIRAIVTSGRGDLIARLPWFLNGTASMSKFDFNLGYNLRRISEF